MATRTKDYNVTRDPSVISKQLVYTDSNENGSLIIPADYFASNDELDSKFVTFYYGMNDEDYPDSTYEEVERQYSQKKKGLRLKTFVAAESVFLYGVMLWNGSKITFSEVIHGELIEATIDRYSNKWEFTRRNVAFKNELDAESTARANADNTLDKKIDDVSETLGGNITTLSGAIADEKNRAEAQENGIRESITDAVNFLDSSIEAVDTKVDTLETKVNTEIAKAIEDLEGSIAVEKARAEGVESTLNSAINGVEGKVDANTSNIVSLTNSKADKTDLDRVEGKVDGKANESDLNDLRYTVNLKANTSDVNRELDKKANTSSVNAELNTLRESIDTKANANETYTKTQVDNKLALKANSVDVSNALALKANASEVYAKTEVDTELGKKVDKVAGKDLQALEAGYVKGDFTKAATCASIDQAIAQATLDPSSFVVDNTFNPNSSNAQSGKALAFLLHEGKLDGNFIGPSNDYNKITTSTQAYWPIYEATLNSYGSFEIELELIQPGYKSLKGKENAYLLFSFGATKNVEGARVQRQQFVRIGNTRGYSNDLFYYSANQSTGKVKVYAKLTETTNSFVLIRLLRSSNYTTSFRYYKDLLSVEDDGLEKVPFTKSASHYFNGQFGSSSSPVFVNSNGTIEACKGIVVPTPPSTGNVVLKSVNGVLSWVAEPSTQSEE